MDVRFAGYAAESTPFTRAAESASAEKRSRKFSPDAGVAARAAESEFIAPLVEESALGANVAAYLFSVVVRAAESEFAAPRAGESASVEKRPEEAAPGTGDAARAAESAPVEKRSRKFAPEASTAARSFSGVLRAEGFAVAAERSFLWRMRAKKPLPVEVLVSDIVRTEEFAAATEDAGVPARSGEAAPEELAAARSERAVPEAQAAAHSGEAALEAQAAARSGEAAPEAQAAARSEGAAPEANAAARSLSVAARGEAPAPAARSEGAAPEAKVAARSEGAVPEAQAAGRAGSWTVCSKRFSPGVSVSRTIVSVRSPPISST